jgi:diaminohydroxyphosphoribosylaminopyrimidine deaminase / 5-amino-6-(5-phosphoribosylamino)uracil reductase
MSENVFDSADRRYMKIALSLSEKGLGLASPNPSVGCVIVRDGKIVGRGLHEYALMDHAEVAALREASENARGATAYVTLEPCCHHGRTGPCASKLIESGVRRVVVARVDPNPKVSGRGIGMLRSAGIAVDEGLFSEEAGRLIESFACSITTGLPLVVAKAGMSLDGKIGTGRREGRWITSTEGREFGQSLRLSLDAILAGVGTVLADDPELTYRGAARKSRPLLRIILDSDLRTPPSARLFLAIDSSPVLIFCRRGAPRKRRLDLEKQGAEIISIPRDGHGLDLQIILQELGKRRVLGLLVEGGSQTHWSFLSSQLIDKFYFIVAPLVLGGSQAIPCVGGEGYKSADEAPKFQIRRRFLAGPDTVIEAYPSYSRSIISPWLHSKILPFAEQDSALSSKRK